MTRFIFLFLLLPFTALATVWQVGPTRQYTKPSQVANLVQNGDIVEIDSAVYVADVCAWNASNLTLRGVGGLARLDANFTAAQGKAIWVISGDNTVVENIEFYNCAVPDHNGAGIRQQGVNLTVRNCYFHDNENGILAGDKAGSTILIEYCRFESNGYSDGYTHNLYINHIDKLIFRYNWSHRAKVGHELKSRAYETYIYCNRITNEDGNASREIDVPNGGKVYLIGNIIQQGPNSENSNIVGYGMEGLSNPGPHELYAVNNTIWNQKTSGSFFQFPNTTPLFKAWNNLILGAGAFIGNNTPAALDTLHNLRYTNPSDAQLVDFVQFNFTPTCAALAINNGADPGMANGYALLPAHMYAHPAGAVARTVTGNAPETGAYEVVCATPTASPAPPECWQQTGRHLQLTDCPDLVFDLWDLSGRLLAANVRQFDGAGSPAGIYLVTVRHGADVKWVGKVVIS